MGEKGEGKERKEEEKDKSYQHFNPHTTLIWNYHFNYYDVQKPIISPTSNLSISRLSPPFGNKVSLCSQGWIWRLISPSSSASASQMLGFQVLPTSPHYLYSNPCLGFLQQMNCPLNFQFWFNSPLAGLYKQNWETISIRWPLARIQQFLR